MVQIASVFRSGFLNPARLVARGLRAGLRAGLCVWGLAALIWAGPGVMAVGVTAAHAQDALEIARVKRGSACPGCNLFQADLSFRVLSGRSFARARLRQAEMVAITLDRANLRGADLAFINAFAGRFLHADFSGADLSDATFTGAYFGRAIFSGANLTRANFSGADLDSVRGLTQAQLDTACGDDETHLAAGLTIPRCK